MNTLRMDTYMHTETHVDAHRNGMRRPENVLTGGGSMGEAVGFIPSTEGDKKGKKRNRIGLEGKREPGQREELEQFSVSGSEG